MANFLEMACKNIYISIYMYVLYVYIYLVYVNTQILVANKSIHHNCSS